METRPVVSFGQLLFEHGIEGYDPTAKDTPTKGVVNAGGAKVFAHYNLSSPTCPISIRNEPLAKLFSAKGVILYAVNRIQLDDEGKPVHVKTGGYNRICAGLMAYASNRQDKAAATELKGRILDIIKAEGLDASDHVEVLSDIPNIDLNCMKSVLFRNALGQNVPIQPAGVVLMAFPSGGPNSNALWSYRNQKASSRSAMSDATTASPQETSDVPF